MFPYDISPIYRSCDIPLQRYIVAAIYLSFDIYRIYSARSRAIFPLILMTLSKIFAREGGSAYSREFSGESFFKDSKTVIKVR